MTDDAKRLGRIETMVARRAHPDVINDLIIRVETQLMAEGAEYFTKGAYALAISKYFWALLLPNRAHRRDEMLQLSIDAYRNLGNGITRLSEIDALKLPEFDDLRIELEDRWLKSQQRELSHRFIKLDGEASLLEKRFDEMENILEQLPLSPKPRLLPELRLPREKRAQELVLEMRAKLKDIAMQPDPDTRAQLLEEVNKLKDQAIDFAAGGSRDYFEQIIDYVRGAEDLLVRTQLEKIINDVDRDSVRVREERFREFRQTLNGNSDELRVLEIICRTLKSFRKEDRLDEIRQVSVRWVKHYAEFRYRHLAIEDPQRAQLSVAGALELIAIYSEDLPQRITGEFKALLEEISVELDPKVEPAHEASKPPSEREGLFRRLFMWATRYKQEDN